MTVAPVCNAVDIRPRAHGQLVVTPVVSLFDGEYNGPHSYYSKLDERAPGNSRHLEAMLDALLENCSEVIKRISVSEERFRIDYTRDPADRQQIENVIRTVLEQFE